MIKLNKKLILASNSPRRKDILTQAGFDFEVKIKDVEEIYPEEMLPQNVPEYLAYIKAKPFINESFNNVILTADTVVLLDNKILGKPKNLDNARTMLNSLSGAIHKVVSGVCILNDEKFTTFSDRTDVHFRKLTLEEIDFYLDIYKPLDKAGSYGIQEWIGMIGVEKIIGSYYNVMGLPIHLIYNQLYKFRLNNVI